MKVDRGFLSRRIDCSCVAIYRSFCGSVVKGGESPNDAVGRLLHRHVHTRHLVDGLAGRGVRCLFNADISGISIMSKS
jgi:hypothetical protein